jgi:hypothetical protein
MPEVHSEEEDDDNEGRPNDEEVVNQEAAQLPWLTDNEFLQKYRMSREAFDFVLSKIKDHEVFHHSWRHLRRKKGRRQAPPAHQLMVFLKFLGTEGSGNSNANQRHTFRIGYGTAEKYRNRVTKAITSLRGEFLYWPDANERNRISREIFEKYNFPHCVLLLDGTLFELAFEPQTEDAPDYSGRKYGYSLSTLIFCDHKKMIRYYLSGYPGSAHDNRIYKGTAVKQHPNQFFSPMQYVVGDSAFENDQHMVSAFKKLPNRQLCRDEELFNTQLAKLRIISEHCIGMLKGRFPWLRSIRLTITEEKKSLRKILQLIDATIILHNMLITFGESEIEEWIDFDDFSDLDEFERAPYEEGDELNSGIPPWAPRDTRRTQLLNYFKEFLFF